MSRPVFSPKARKGFTLVELAVVIVIIGVLAAFGVPRFLKSVERSKAAEAFSYLSAVRSSQERYLAQYGEYATRHQQARHPVSHSGLLHGRNRGAGHGHDPEFLDADLDPNRRLGRLWGLHGDLHRSGLRRRQLGNPGDPGHQPDQQRDRTTNRKLMGAVGSTTSGILLSSSGGEQDPRRAGGQSRSVLRLAPR